MYGNHTSPKKAPWAVHLTLGLDWGPGGGPIFEVVSQLDAKECPGKLPTESS